MNISKRIETELISKGLRDVDVYNHPFAKSARISKANVYQWKNGKATPTIEKAYALCRILGRSLRWLVEGVDDNEVNFKVRANKERDPEVQSLIEILDKGDINDKAFKDLVRAFSNIIQIAVDVEAFTIEHKDDNEEDRRDLKNRPFWQPGMIEQINDSNSRRNN